MSPDEIQANYEVLKSLAHPTRIAVVYALLEGEMTAGEIFQLFETFDISTVSKHLSVLKNARIISNRRAGSTVIYRLETPCVANCLRCVVNVVEEIKRNRDGRRAGKEA